MVYFLLSMVFVCVCVHTFVRVSVLLPVWYSKQLTYKPKHETEKLKTVLGLNLVCLHSGEYIIIDIY